MAKKNAGLDAIISNIEKQMKDKGVIVRYGDIKKEEYQTISFGYPDVDEASNCGGIARGKIIEIFGPESGGKSFLTLKLIASAQKAGLACCLVDVEQSFEAKWAAKHGVNVDDLFVISKPMSAESNLDYVDLLCKSGGFGLVVVDSTAALIPQKELEGSISDQDYALLARALSKGVKKIVSGCGQTGTTCVFINQIREKMGVMFGNPETTPGGRALRFYAHQRIMVVPGTKVKMMDGDKEKVVARKSKVTFVKNKTAAPFGECEIEIVFLEGALNPLVKLCNLAKDYKLIGMRNSLFQIKKEVLSLAKNLDTGASTIIELADYVVKNGYVKEICDAYVAAVEEEDKKIDKSVVDLIAKPDEAVSPLAGKTVKVENVKNDEELIKELGSSKEETEEDLDIDK